MVVAIVTPLLLAAPGGCERAPTEDRPAGSGTAATMPAATAPVEVPAVSVVTIGGRAYEFPSASILLDERDVGVVAQVYSEGASPEGLTDGYYLEMTLDVPGAGEIDGASWQYTSRSGERSDDPSAITVNSGGNQLQPRDVTATFRAVGEGAVEVRVVGFFSVFDSRESTAAGGTVAVEATIVARRQAS